MPQSFQTGRHNSIILRGTRFHELKEKGGRNVYFLYFRKSMLEKSRRFPVFYIVNRISLGHKRWSMHPLSKLSKLETCVETHRSPFSFSTFILSDPMYIIQITIYHKIMEIFNIFVGQICSICHRIYKRIVPFSFNLDKTISSLIEL